MSRNHSLKKNKSQQNVKMETSTYVVLKEIPFAWNI